MMRTKSQFSRNVYAIRDKIRCNKHLRHTTTEKYDNNVKDWYFRFDDDNKMSKKFVLSITWTYIWHHIYIIYIYIYYIYQILISPVWIPSLLFILSRLWTSFWLQTLCNHTVCRKNPPWFRYYIHCECEFDKTWDDLIFHPFDLRLLKFGLCT